MSDDMKEVISLEPGELLAGVKTVKENDLPPPGHMWLNTRTNELHVSDGDAMIPISCDVGLEPSVLVMANSFVEYLGNVWSIYSATAYATEPLNQSSPDGLIFVLQLRDVEYHYWKKRVMPRLVKEMKGVFSNLRLSFGRQDGGTVTVSVYREDSNG